MAKKMTGARYAAETFKTYGVTHVFFMDAFYRRTLYELARLGITRILPHSEKAAAYMADGYARASGRVGVCFCQSVGTANLAAGLQDAYLHRAPVVALTGRKPPMFRQRNAYQELDHAPLYAPVTKYQASVEIPEEYPLFIAQAFREATAGTPRPVHLDIPGLRGDFLEAAEFDGPPVVDARHGRFPARRQLPAADEIAEAAKAIAAAKRPVLVCGAGAAISGAGAEILKLAEALEAPIATTTGGRSVIPTTHRLAIGTVGLYAAPPANQVVHQADLVIYVGSHTGDQATCDWTVPAPGTAIVQIDVDAVEIGRNYPNTVGVVADPKLALATLMKACKGQKPRAAWARKAAGIMSKWRKAMAPKMASGATPIAIDRLCADVSAALPANAIIVADTGYSTIWTCTMVELPHPGQTFMRAAGSLGWSFPAAIGAKCGAPDRPVVCFSGDGAFYYHLPELETVRRWNIPVVVVINNNSAFGQGLERTRAIYAGSNYSPDEVIRFGPTDFAAIARAFGVEGMRIERPDEVKDAIEHAIALNKPVVVDVVTDAETHPPEPWLPGA